MNDLITRWRLACEIARRSKDPSTKVGAVLFSETGRLLGTACNALPPELDTPEHWADTEYRREHVIHAERRLLQGIYRPLVYHGTLYTSCIPCADCANLIAFVGISAVVCGKTDPEREARWHVEQTRKTFYDKSITLIEVSM